MVTRTVEDSKRFFSDLPKALSSNVSSVFQSIFGESFSKASDENQLKADIERRKQEATNSRMKNVSNDEINSKRQVTIALPVREATASSIKRNEEKKETKVVVETTPQKVDVHVTGFCIRCKNDMEGSNQMLSNSPAAGNR
jgi:cation transport regulator ChaB